MARTIGPVAPRVNATREPSPEGSVPAEARLERIAGALNVDEQELDLGTPEEGDAFKEPAGGARLLCDVSDERQGRERRRPFRGASDSSRAAEWCPHQRWPSTCLSYRYHA